MKEICVIKRLNKMLPRNSLLTIYKSFAWPHLEMTIYFMIKQIIKGYVKKLRLFNTMLLWPFPVPSKVHLELSFTTN